MFLGGSFNSVLFQVFVSLPVRRTDTRPDGFFFFLAAVFREFPASPRVLRRFAGGSVAIKTGAGMGELRNALPPTPCSNRSRGCLQHGSQRVWGGF